MGPGAWGVGPGAWGLGRGAWGVGRGFSSSDNLRRTNSVPDLSVALTAIISAAAAATTASTTTTFPAVFAVMSRASRMETPDESRVDKDRLRRHSAIKRDMSRV